MSELPLFFNYQAEGKPDYGYEAIQDFFLSWTFRCSAAKYDSLNPKLNLYAKRLTYALWFGKNDHNGFTVNYTGINDFEILDVKTKRQYLGIDLLVEIEVSISNKKEKKLLNIENKWYTILSDNQLSNYKDNLKNSEYRNWDIRNLVIFCDYEKLHKPELLQIAKCVEAGYLYTCIDELIGIAMHDKELTGNYLFDEYWFGFNGR